MRGCARSSKPPSCSHRCKEGQPASCSSKSDSRITDRHNEVPSAQWPKMYVQMAKFPRGKARPARAPWWSASGDLLARTMQDQPRAPHGGQPVEQPRATADTTCGFVVKPGQGRCQSEPSLTTYPSRNRGRGQQGFQHFQRGEPA